MANQRKRFNQKTKTKVAIEAIKEQKTTAEISSEYKVHATQITRWKKQAIEIIPQAFSRKHKRSEAAQQELIDDLYKQIGKLSVECEWLKKIQRYPLTIICPPTAPEKGKAAKKKILTAFK